MEHYQIDLRFQLAEDHLDSLINLYQPLFTLPALGLYMTLYGMARHESHESKINRRELLLRLHLDIPTFESYRKELERFMLIRTFASDNAIVCILQQPLRPIDFFQHATFGRLYAIVMGNQDFLRQKEKYSKGFVDITSLNELSAPFDLNRLASWNHENESVFKTKTTPSINSNRFDGMQFFKTVPISFFPVSMRTQDVVEVVETMGSLYGISYTDMKAKVLAASDIKRKEFDKQKFVIGIEREFGKLSPSKVKDPYELDSLSFLAYKQNNDYIIEADKRLLQSLSHNFKFSHQVINVLIEYVLEINDMKLNKAYVEKVASTWSRLGVKSLEDALAAKNTKPEKKQASSKPNRVAVTPKYDTTPENVENIDEYRQIIKEFFEGDE